MPKGSFKTGLGHIRAKVKDETLRVSEHLSHCARSQPIAQRSVAKKGTPGLSREQPSTAHMSLT